MNDSSPNNGKCLNLKMCSFNCKGFKQSTSYISEFVNDHDVVCLSETWLWPAELSLIADSIIKMTKADETMITKSAMNDVIP